MTIIIRNDADMIRWVLKAPERHPKLVFGCEPAIAVKAPEEIMEVIPVHLESVHATCRYAQLLCQTHHYMCHSRIKFGVPLNLS